MRESTEDRWETETHLISCRQTPDSAVNRIWCGRQTWQLLCETKRLLLDVDHFFDFFYTLTGTTANRLAPKKTKKWPWTRKPALGSYSGLVSSVWCTMRFPGGLSFKLTLSECLVFAQEPTKRKANAQMQKSSQVVLWRQLGSEVGSAK
jgi:hypothetical protein